MTEISEILTNIRKIWDRASRFAPLLKVMQDFPSLEIYLVGGVLRDLILGRAHDPKDFDFCLGGDCVQAALERLEGCGHMRFGPFGSPRWFHPTSDQYCDLMPIATFYNGLWKCRDIVDVLNQFDFTGNAVGLDLRIGEFFDTQNGSRDLHERVMRAIRFDYPDEPIMRDASITRPAVIWFRILHYAAALHLTIEPVTMRWLIHNQHHRHSQDVFSQTFFSPHPDSFRVLFEPSKGDLFDLAETLRNA